jgi:hypothetical protein
MRVLQPALRECNHACDVLRREKLVSCDFDGKGAAKEVSY